jgi:hypothetical protein
VTTRSRTLPAKLDTFELIMPNREGTDAAKGPFRAM